jgi:hypothetical protein
LGSFEGKISSFELLIFTSAEGSINHALDEGFDAWRSDLEDVYSDESIADFLRMNEYEFTEDGDKWDGE